MPLPPDADARPLVEELTRIADRLGSEPKVGVRASVAALCVVVAQLPSPCLEQVWPLLGLIQDGWYRSQVLVALALRSEGAERDRAGRAAVEALLEPGPADADHRAMIVEEAASILSPELVTHLLEGAAEFEERGRIRALKALFPLVRTEQLDTALTHVRRLSNDSSRADLLRLLDVGALDAAALDAVIVVVNEITNELHRVSALVALAEGTTIPLLDGLVAAAARLTLAADRAKVMARLLSAPAHADALLPHVRRDLVDHLHCATVATRADVLQLLADPYLFEEPVVDSATARRAIDAAVAVCRDWQWP
jgi:hypothetical protein